MNKFVRKFLEKKGFDLEYIKQHREDEAMIADIEASQKFKRFKVRTLLKQLIHQICGLIRFSMKKLGKFLYFIYFSK